MSERVVTVRPARAADADFVVASEAENLGADAWSGALVSQGIAGQVPTVGYLIAEVDGRPVGHAVLSVAGDIAELQRIAVLAPLRRTGVARALLAQAIASARSQEAERVLLEVREDNIPAIACYRSEGFTEIDRRPGYYKDGAAAVVMMLDLNRAH